MTDADKAWLERPDWASNDKREAEWVAGALRAALS